MGEPIGYIGLEELADCYRVYGVRHPKGGICDVDLAKGPLGHAFASQDFWKTYSTAAFEIDDFIVGSAPSYHALFTTLYKLKDQVQYKGLVGKVRKFLRNVFSAGGFVWTLSRAIYNPQDEDDVVAHTIDNPAEEYIIKVKDLTGNGEYKEACEALLGTGDTGEISEVYHWISGKDTLIGTIQQKPDTHPHLNLGVTFGVRKGHFCVVAGSNKDYPRPAVGIRVHKISQHKQLRYAAC